MADLVIGGRRHGPPRTWRAAFFAALLALGLLVVAWFIYWRAVSYDVPAGTPPRGAPTFAAGDAGQPPRLVYGESSLAWAGPIAVLRASGDPHTIGAAQGRLLGAPVRRAARELQPSIDESVDHGGWLGGWLHGTKIAWRHRDIDDGVPEPMRRAIAGLARGAAGAGAPVAYADLLRQQAILDVGAPAPWTAEAVLRRLSRALTVVIPQPTPGRVWVGRSFSLPGVGEGGDDLGPPVVSFVRPAGRKAWAGVGWPSLVGVVTGINQDAIVVTVQPAQASDVRPTREATPIALLARDVLERAGDLDAAVKLIVDTPTLGAAAFTIVDGKTGRWAVVDRSPTRTAVRRDPSTPAVGDVMQGGSFADDPLNDRAARISATTARTDRAARLARSSPPDVAAVVAALRDTRGATDAPLPPGHRAAVADPSALHVALIDPGAMVLYVSETGTAAGALRAFDLRHELGVSATGAMPPPDLPDAGAWALWRERSVRAARAEVRAARRALRDGATGRAVERVGRALALEPALPEALELAGRLARRRGDHDAAQEIWRRWLEAGADDPGAEQEIRAVLGI